MQKVIMYRLAVQLYRTGVVDFIDGNLHFPIFSIIIASTGSSLIIFILFALLKGIFAKKR